MGGFLGFGGATKQQSYSAPATSIVRSAEGDTAGEEGKKRRKKLMERTDTLLAGGMDEGKTAGGTLLS